MNSFRAFFDRWRDRLGPLGFAALTVFVITKLGDASTLVSRFVIGRWLPELDFGGFEPVFSVLSLLSVPVAVIYHTGVKSISRLMEQQKTGQCAALLRDLVKTALVGSIVSLGLVFLLKDVILSRLYLDSPAYAGLLGILLVVAWWTPLSTAIVQGSRRFHLLILTVVLGPFLGLLLTCLLVGRMELGLQGALFARGAGMVLPTIVVFFCLRQLFAAPREPYREELRQLRSMMVWMAVYLSSFVLLWHFDRLFVRNFLVEHSGGFGAVVTVGQIPLWLIGPVVFVLFPLASAEHAAGRDVQKLLRQAITWGVLIVLGFVAVFYFVATPVFRLWNPVFVPYARYVWLYGLSMGLQALVDVVCRVEMARHRYSFLAWLVVPTILMCGWFYFFARDTATLGHIIGIMAAGRLVVLAGVLICSVRRREEAPTKHTKRHE